MNDAVGSGSSGCFAWSATTVATPYARSSSKNSGTTKLGCRTSTTWRSARPSSRAGSSFRNASKSAASKTLVGSICQLIGPSFSFSSSTPPPRNRSTDAPASASTRRLVANRGPFTANKKPSGVSSRQRAKLSGFCAP